MPSFPIQLKRNGTAAATPSSLLHGEVALNYADGKLFWKDASNVIRSFTFQAYALSSHTHAASDITSGTLDAARLPLATTIAAGAVIVGTGLGVSSGTVSVTYGTSAGTACQGNDSRLSDARTPTSHSHGNITNAGAIGSTANLPIITTTSGVLTTGSFGTTAATFCEGNDSRLSDTRTPTDGSVTTAKLANDAVTYAKIQNVSATDRLLGRSSAGSGDVEEITCTAFGRSLIDDADAAAARSTLSVQPTASPAFTGAATVTNDGNVVPLTVTNTGTANSFVVNDASGDTSPFVIDASGAVLTGGALTVRANSGSASHLFTYNENGGEIILYDEAQVSATLFDQISTDTRLLELVNGSNLKLGLGGGNTTGSIQFMRAGYVESVVINSSGQLLVTAGSASACGVAFSGDGDTGIAQLSAAGANTLSICTGGGERVRVDASGNVLVGATPSPAFSGVTPNLQAVTTSFTGSDVDGGTIGAFGSSSFAVDRGAGVVFGFKYNTAGNYVTAARVRGAKENATDGNYAGYLAFDTRANAGNITERARITAAGELLIGTTTDNGAYLLQVNSQIYATNATIATSDARFKTNVETLTDATAVIEALRPVAFDFIPHEERNFATERQVGLIAQEAQAALAGCGYADSVVAQCGDHLGLAYEKLVPVLIKALQESNARIAALEERLNHA